MLLAIDVGNTHTVLGVYDGDALVGHWRIGTRARETADELGVLVHSLFRAPGSGLPADATIDAAILSSVVPPLTDTLVQMVAKSFPGVRCKVVGPGLKTG
ncbi:MAG: type III pantothenate kinase, partial [Myxococcales bacterium]|nr:type III pantothenate kinase [Myxococcales bacterium]